MTKGIRLLLVFQLLFAWGGLLAQNITSSIIGNVADPSGAAVQGAHITVRNTGTGAITTATTGTGGSYSVPGLLSGTYEVTAEKEGFEAFRTTNVVVSASENKRVDARLSVGEVQQT